MNVIDFDVISFIYIIDCPWIFVAFYDTSGSLADESHVGLRRTLRRRQTSGATLSLSPVLLARHSPALART